MKIQLKRSNVLDGLQAKEPTAGQMEYGELAVNYNVDDPAIFIKDSDNNIIRIGGVGNIQTMGRQKFHQVLTHQQTHCLVTSGITQLMVAFTITTKMQIVHSG